MPELPEHEVIAASLVRAQTLAVVRKLSKGLGPDERTRLAATLLNTVAYSRLEIGGDCQWLTEMLKDFWQWASDEHRRTLANAVCEQLTQLVRDPDLVHSHSHHQLILTFVKAAGDALKDELARAAVQAETLTALSGHGGR